jgi:3-deoxy-manno-octulosonate cytidylyltransferase (CMP-KDO synthetase)
MICWTVARASRTRGLGDVFVAAEDPEIVAAVQKHGFKAELVRGDFKTGSDRVAFAVRNLEAPVIVNIQADEPLLDPEIVDQALRLLEAHPEFDVTTAVRPIRDYPEYTNPNCVKAVLDQNQRCLFFSRSPLPAIRKASPAHVLPAEIPFYKHLGLYCFRREALIKFGRMQESPLERCEGLEQLRILEWGGTIGAVVTITTAPDVNSPEDLLAVQDYLKNHNIQYT